MSNRMQSYGYNNIELENTLGNCSMYQITKKKKEREKVSKKPPRTQTRELQFSLRYCYKFSMPQFSMQRFCWLTILGEYRLLESF